MKNNLIRISVAWAMFYAVLTHANPGENSLSDSGVISSKAIPLSHIRTWLEHADSSTKQAFSLARLGRNMGGGSPWFDSKKSLEYKDGKLVAVKYHMSFFVAISGSPDVLKEDAMRVKNGLATHIVRYDLVTKQWSLVRPPKRK